jgi:hypothetical protein
MPGQLKLRTGKVLKINTVLVFSAPRPYFLIRLWYMPCIGWCMLTTLTAPGLTLLFLGVVVGLGTAFVWMLWEIEQMSKPRRNSDRFG